MGRKSGVAVAVVQVACFVMAVTGDDAVSSQPMSMPVTPSAPASMASISKDLVAWWPLDGHLHDLVGGHHLTAVDGKPVFATRPGAAGAVAVFDADWFAQASKHKAFDSTDGLTVSLWFNSPRQKNDNVALLSYMSETCLGYRVAFEWPLGDNLEFDLGSNVGARVWRHRQKEPWDQKWHQAVCTFQKGGKSSLYYDGRVADTHDDASFLSPNDPQANRGGEHGITLGNEAHARPDLRKYVGQLDEVMIFSRGLTAQEVDLLHYPLPPRVDDLDDLAWNALAKRLVDKPADCLYAIPILAAGGEAAAKALAAHTPAATTMPAVEDLVRQLDDDEWKRREEATTKLIGLGSTVRPVLVGIRDASPEVKARIERILREVRGDDGLSLPVLRIILALERNGSRGACTELKRLASSGRPESPLARDALGRMK